MARRSDPFAFFSNAMEMGHMMAEANAVIAMRSLGMMGLWSVTPSEDKRMVSEKIEAVTRSVNDATKSMLKGDSADQITAAALKPLRQKTRANAKRLTKRGPKRS